MPVSDQSQQHAIKTVWWEEDAHQATVCMLDQSLLPQQVVVLHLPSEQQVADAIRTLKVRGAPAIGVAAALGMLLAMHRFLQERTITGKTLSPSELQTHLTSVGQLLRGTRPTAVNLSWAVERMLHCSASALAESVDPQSLLHRLRHEAFTIAAEDVAAGLKMGQYGAELIADGTSLLTHCNAGALAASAGPGTALAPIYTAHQAGKHIHVFVDETRPVLQGARLTAWELQRAGVPLTLITDNMAGHFMRRGEIAAVFVGADRIAANGDAANKIGTYSLAVLAQAHSLPFYVVAPCSTLDLSVPSGNAIPIEQRNSTEVTAIQGVQLAPHGIQVANPAFDVTPCSLITAIITERGIARFPYDVSLRRLCEQV
ncbi:MAG: S-methyl-5-thioribose-1-phosphate isomerase [Ktedonobacteraceae bacterium]|nr:S-methyl-5-thioribose-1-phosphate isomerase [Ktedonobacteraceae bacterium]